MYGPIWRALPGGWPVKLIQVVVLALVVVALCFLWLFPAIAPHLPFNANTVDAASLPVTGPRLQPGSSDPSGGTVAFGPRPGRHPAAWPA